MVAPRCRSVNDYQTTADLRCALTGNNKNKNNNGGTTIASCLEHQDDKELDWMLYNYDQTNSIPQRVEYELKRLQVLKSYHVLDDFGQEEAGFTRITHLASRMLDMPIALVSLVDMGRQYFVSVKGLGDTKEMPRSISFCTHAILSYDDVFCIPDATQDFRFCQNPLVTGPDHIRFYAGAPLLSPEGFKLGALCVLDRQPRDALSLKQKQNLRELAAVVVENLVDRRTARRRALGQGMATTAHDLLAPVTSMSQNLLRALADKENNRELLITFLRCSELMSRICQGAILEEAREARHVLQQRQTSSGGSSSAPAGKLLPGSDTDSALLWPSFGQEQDKNNNNDHSRIRPQEEEKRPEDDDDLADLGSSSNCTTKIRRLVEDLEGVISPYPKRVPVQMDIDPTLKDEELWVGNDLKVARSAINLLVNACQRADRGQVTLRVFSKTNKDEQNLLVWEVQDNGPAVPVESYPTLFQPTLFAAGGPSNGNNDNSKTAKSRMMDKATLLSELGLLSVASNVDSLNGDYGFYAKEQESALPSNVFWFAIPMKKKEKGHDDWNQNNEEEKYDKDKDDFVDPFVFQQNQVQEDEEEEEEVVFDSSSLQEQKENRTFVNDDTDVRGNDHPPPARFRGLGHCQDSTQSSSKLVTWETDEAIQHAEPPISLPMGGGIADSDPYALDDNENSGDAAATPSWTALEEKEETDASPSDNHIRVIPRQRSRKYSVDQADLRNAGSGDEQDEKETKESEEIMRAEQDDVVSLSMPTHMTTTTMTSTTNRRPSSVMSSSSRRHSELTSSLISSAASSSSSLYDHDIHSMPTLDDLKVQMEAVRAIQRRNGGIGRRASLDSPKFHIPHPALTTRSSSRRDSLTFAGGNGVGSSQFHNYSRRSSLDSPASAANGQMGSAPLPRPLPRQRRALVIDDSITVRKSLDRTLTRLGYDVVQAANGMQGLKELQSHCFDVSFVDFLMPVVDGMDCVQQFREWEKEHRGGNGGGFRQYIIGISSHGSDEAIVQQGLQVGMDKFVSKPITSSFVKEFHASPERTQISLDLDAHCNNRQQGRKVDNVVVLEDEDDIPPPPPPPSRVSTGGNSMAPPLSSSSLSPVGPSLSPLPPTQLLSTERPLSPLVPSTTTIMVPPPPLPVSLVMNGNSSIRDDTSHDIYKNGMMHLKTTLPSDMAIDSLCNSPLTPSLDPNDLAKLKAAARSAVPQPLRSSSASQIMSSPSSKRGLKPLPQRGISTGVSVPSIPTNGMSHSNTQGVGPPCCLIGVRSRPAAVALYRCVEARGWRASTVDDGANALRLLKMRSWDLVFLDENLPGMSGAASVAHFREWEQQQRDPKIMKKRTHIYLLSDRYSGGNNTNGASVSPNNENTDIVNGILGKPIQSKELTRILNVASGGKHGTPKQNNNNSKMGVIHRRADNVRGMMKRIMLPRK